MYNLIVEEKLNTYFKNLIYILKKIEITTSYEDFILFTHISGPNSQMSPSYRTLRTYSTEKV